MGAAAIPVVIAGVQIFMGHQESKKAARNAKEMGEYNARLTELETAEMRRQEYEQFNAQRSSAIARSVAAGFELSGSPAVYMAELERVHAKTDDWISLSGASKAAAQRKGANVVASEYLARGRAGMVEAAGRGAAGYYALRNQPPPSQSSAVLSNPLQGSFSNESLPYA